MPNRPKRIKRPWQKERVAFKSVVSHQEFYNSRRWREFSRAYREKNPFCVKCHAKGIVRQSDVTDHIERIKDKGPKFDESNLQALCHSCHNSKSGKEAHGYKERK
tara:strand:- start:26 stop:340 length:315 start_codon:yes stop_codon:yes gene_type:complete